MRATRWVGQLVLLAVLGAARLDEVIVDVLAICHGFLALLSLW